MPYQISREAEDDIISIATYTMDGFGVEQTIAYRNGLIRTFNFLADHPRVARLREEISPPVRAYPYKSHMIVYDLDEDDTVIILRVRHAREDWQAGPAAD